MPKYEILDIDNNVLNTIIANEDFMIVNYPGQFRLVDEPTVDEPKTTIFTKLQFQLRFTFDELVAIETVAETNPAVRVLQRQQETADFIDISDQNTILGIMYLVSVSLLTNERAIEILTP